MQSKGNIKDRNDTNLLMNTFLGLCKKILMEISRSRRVQQVYSHSASSVYVHFEAAMKIYSTSSRIKQILRILKMRFLPLSNSSLSVSLTLAYFEYRVQLFIITFCRVVESR